MNPWRSQHYLRIGREHGVDSTVLKNAVATAGITSRAAGSAPPILTLRHLCHLTRAPYPFLRQVIGRRAFAEHYRTFSIRKRGPVSDSRRRSIAVPVPDLMSVQRWIARNVLATATPHPASRAFAPECSILDAARPHCGARWLVKIDVRHFFESISELSVNRVFIELGYQPLVAFELARLCTRTRRYSRRAKAEAARWQIHCRNEAPSAYLSDVMGYLPQGAPTSPMLANLAVRPLDVHLERIAHEFGMVYSRYADDLTFSTRSSDFSRRGAGELINRVYGALGRQQLSPNTAKTAVIPPRARKVVLGLLVDGEAPQLTRSFRHQLRQHLYYLGRADIGPARHAQARGFASIEGLRHYLYGRVAFAGQIDPLYADRCRAELDRVTW